MYGEAAIKEAISRALGCLGYSEIQDALFKEGIMCSRVFLQAVESRCVFVLGPTTCLRKYGWLGKLSKHVTL